ncbi:N-acetylglucosamine-6-phosphate deacetylase [Dysgonomonas sp. 511]|uniref:N-acetylglucosamine-6-phosphate deacetylase n=1 Tax=Dysgonomonas sp. 511 TaxID=2302930 RepID=UPI0013D0F498|nr:N-acetylglucosamine-6-phosphate deacetylase [Dysgonomonas sp. 511]NDV78199.1 N-acetylglucosamine-6-phosphate deacetylase [Dysgonomonas sp. 511]
MKKIFITALIGILSLSVSNAQTSNEKLKIFNGKVITPYSIIDNACVLVENGKIIDVRAGNVDFSGAKEIDAKGKYISPGFIDTHCHGGGGHDFMDGTPQAMIKAAELHAKHGTTLIYPTSASCSDKTLFEMFDNYRKADKMNTTGAAFGGIHIEGGYLNKKMSGGQDPRYVIDPQPEHYNKILEKGGDIIARWSMAPELPGALDLARELRKRNIQTSMAHTAALYDEAVDAFDAGFSSITHFYSLTSTVTRKDALRYAGVIEAGYNLDNLYVEAIADGVHLPSPLLKLIYKVKGADRVVLVTDAMRGAGMPDGKSILGSLEDGVPVIIEDGVAKLPDRSSFAGSVATTDRLVRTYMTKGGANLLDAVQMLTLSPAKLMKIDDAKGSIAKGKDADIIIFDENINVQATIVGGRIIYEAR